MPFKAVTEGEYKGKPTLTLSRNEEDRFPFSFGASKARLIIEHIDAIKAFVKKHSVKA